MLRNITPTQVMLSFGTLFGNFFYHHRHQIRVAIDMEPMPVLPDIDSDPPPPVKFDPQVEKKVDNVVAEIEKYAGKKTPVPIIDNLEYKGDYKKKDGKVVPNGKGIYYAKDTQYKMVGTFKEGTVEGPGMFRYPEGIIVKTEFKNGEIKGPGVKYFEDAKFEGELLDGKPHGSGVYTFKDGGKIFVMKENGLETAKCYDDTGKLWYKGEYKDGKFNGQGEFYYVNGRKYVGEYKDGQKEGNGVVTDEYGDVMYKGPYSKDRALHRWKLYTEPGIIFGVVLVNILTLFKR